MVGTSFNVRLIHKNTEVIVETGKVAVFAAGKSWNLYPGDKLLIGVNGELLSEGTTDLLYQYYRSHKFEARNIPLWRMVEVLNEAYDVDISISNQNVRNLTLSCKFQNESMDNILNVLAETFRLKVEKNGKQIRLGK